MTAHPTRLLPMAASAGRSLRLPEHPPYRVIEVMPPFLRRVQLRNYKSIAECDVALGPLTFLVGPNGSGKSNFVDSLRFIADSLTRSLDQAVRDRP